MLKSSFSSLFREDIHRAWENIQLNIKPLAKESLGVDRSSMNFGLMNVHDI